MKEMNIFNKFPELEFEEVLGSPETIHKNIK